MYMEIKIHTQNLELTAEQEARVHEKIEKLTHFAHKIGDSASTIRVDLIHEASKKPEEAFVCTLTLFVPHDTLRAEARDASVEAVVDDVVEKIKAPIERYKDKMHHISERH